MVGPVWYRICTIGPVLHMDSDIRPLFPVLCVLWSFCSQQQKQYSLLEALGALSPAFTRSSGGLFKGSSSEFLKTGTATSSGEVRVVVILAHLVFLRGMGNQWLGRNAPTVIQHLLDLLAQPKAVGTHITAVHSRNSILFVLNESFGRVLQEASQVHVAKIMCTLAIRYLTLSKDTSSDSKTSSYQHELVCVFLFLALLVVKLNTAALSLLTSDGSSLSPDANNQGPLLEAMSSGLTHSCKDVRLAAGWCARSIGATLQTELPLLVDYFISKLRESLSSSEAVCGLSSAVAALLASTRDSQLGIPAQKISVSLCGVFVEVRVRVLVYVGAVLVYVGAVLVCGGSPGVWGGSLGVCGGSPGVWGGSLGV